MKIARVSCGKEMFYCVIDGENVRRISGTPYDGLNYDGMVYSLSDVKLLSPVEPRNIICLGRNYYDHIIELGNTVPDEPLLFYKPATSVIGPEDNVVYPNISERVDHEAELAVVIGKKATAIHPGKSGEYILGYTCLNDITARDIQSREKQFVRSKGCDTFCPIGPWIETELDSGNVNICCRVNGQIKQNSSTSLMMHSIDEIICYITQCITLYPGDVISTGSPAGVSPMIPGDTVEVEIEGIGILRNRIV